MDERTLAALRGSIEKWTDIEEGRGTDQGSSNCLLCKLFRDDECDGCPVYEVADFWSCVESPYDAFADWDRGRGDGWRTPINPATDTEGVRLARAEREFLESLLPEGEEP